MFPSSLIIKWEIGSLSPACKDLSALPSLYIFCQPKDQEILDLYGQWEDYVCEDNSYPLPVNNNGNSISYPRQVDDIDIDIDIEYP